MSDMHILTANDDGEFQIVMHFDVPAGNNQAGVSWATALMIAGLNATILPDGDGAAGTISAAEKTTIQNGTIREHVVDFPVQSDGITLTKTRATLRELYAAEKIRTNAGLQRRLRWFGRNESEA